MFSLNPKNAWLFDVDGVITNPQEKSITETEMIPELIKRLENNEPVSLVSGRALDWLKMQVINKIENSTKNPNILNNLFISAEFGGISMHFENGNEKIEIDNNVSLPKDLILKLGFAVETDFRDITFIDKEKVTHFTAELNNDKTVEEFKTRQNLISDKFQEIINKFPEKDEIEVHNDRIATNVKNKKLNKHLAIQKVLAWLNLKGINPDKFQVFGDSASDFEMGKELYSQNKNFKFIFVGEKVPDNLPFEVNHQGGVDHGTLEYLKAN